MAGRVRVLSERLMVPGKGESTLRLSRACNKKKMFLTSGPKSRREGPRCSRVGYLSSREPMTHDRLVEILRIFLIVFTKACAHHGRSSERGRLICLA